MGAELSDTLVRNAYEAMDEPADALGRIQTARQAVESTLRTLANAAQATGTDEGAAHAVELEYLADAVARITGSRTKPAVAKAANEVVDELLSAMRKFTAFNSPHEGYAVILEELDEMWDEVRANNTERAIEEAVQVAAMAIRFIVDMRAPATNPRSTT
jgi:predicted phage gp36 major capsid-like protein